MMTDAEKTHRWLTEAELQTLLAEARATGFKAGAKAMRDSCWAAACEDCGPSIRSLSVTPIDDIPSAAVAESFRLGAMQMQQAIVRRLHDLATYPWPAEQKRVVENCAVVALIEKLPEGTPIDDIPTKTPIGDTFAEGQEKPCAT